MHREVLAEERRLQEALDRVRLEEAAKRPHLSKWQWLWKILIFALLYAANANSEYQYLLNIIVVVCLMDGGNSRVHSRIDALIELAKLDKGRK
ncbi:hypothetical protein JIN84_13680 [Luteolibacter yonseiensis]|uniref:Uncharacterized protein n=1 Tax=Luteolibacter yonseiensis TaxID=1144680 RepID=A0A934R3Z0_9BACT|nr:hypothetical protein [Luteolibacter yonseiensis]MBK1816671.1 hypothetical protein [Luteolibacter yonseiensis]